jgi:predicted O-methyltransferase YrrM
MTLSFHLRLLLHYPKQPLRLSRPGTAIVLDKVIRVGAIIDPNDPDPNVQGVRRCFQKIAAGSRLDATTIQTVESEGSR